MVDGSHQRARAAGATSHARQVAAGLRAPAAAWLVWSGHAAQGWFSAVPGCPSRPRCRYHGHLCRAGGSSARWAIPGPPHGCRSHSHSYHLRPGHSWENGCRVTRRCTHRLPMSFCRDPPCGCRTLGLGVAACRNCRHVLCRRLLCGHL